jgi:hypothetical protein
MMHDKIRCNPIGCRLSPVTQSDIQCKYPFKSHLVFSRFAGQYSCFFVYLRLVMDFSKEAVAMFIAAIGILSVIAQTGFLALLMKTLGSKHTIMVGLLFEMLQLMWYGFGSQTWMMWAAGILASISR